MPTRRAATPPRPDLEDALFPDQPAFEAWLESNRESSPGINSRAAYFVDAAPRTINTQSPSDGA